MKKNIIFLLLISFCFSINLLISQPNPPNDPSCYSNYYDCTTWTAWSNWITVYAKFAETGNCQMYAMCKVRHCASDPSIIEVWIGQFGIIPPLPGEDCETALHYLYPNWPSTSPMDYDHSQKIKMKLYRQAVLQEFSSIPIANRPVCDIDQPLKYGMRFPGS